ncbi:MAG: hypothetical protein CMI75_06850 [Candidatus Pelagibacter sp.]|nr:hypothetical protein [Candidatus Pelagibacter sp.]
MLNIINKYIENLSLSDALDIGTTNDQDNKSSNFLIRNIKNIRLFKSISNQKINLGFFSKILTKSITNNFSEIEIKNFKSDLVLSNATLEHVGNSNNQMKMIKNVIDLTKKIFIISTPNRFHPIDFHTKIPFIHWLPKKIHRFLLNLIGLKYFSKEENLNLCSKKDLINMLKNYKNIKYKIFHINLFYIKSNFLIIGEIIN